MVLSLENIGKVGRAVVELNGITVIAGENNTGKSTVGKALYSIFNSYYKIEEKIQQERLYSVEQLLDIFYNNVSEKRSLFIDTQQIAHSILAEAERNTFDQNKLQEFIIEAFSQNDSDFINHVKDNDWEGYFKRILNVINVSNQEILSTLLLKKMNAEFNGQINNIFSEESGKLELQIKNEIVSIKIEDNAIKSFSNGFQLQTEVLYLDDPFVLDEQKLRGFYRQGAFDNHRDHLRSKLFGKDSEGNIINQILATNKLDKIYEKMESVCGGNLVHVNGARFGYKRANSEKILDVKNISTGLKTFVILKTLLQNGALEENGTIILDEPEIHLHPEWQVLFAELIVLIQKEFHMHILLNTHSPYFLNAIEVYAAKHQIADRCNYYMAYLDGDISNIEDVSDHIEVIYQRLAQPLQNLENERWSGNG